MSLLYTNGTLVIDGFFCSAGSTDAYLCLCCLKRYFKQKNAIKHEETCHKIDLPDGVNIITKEHLKGNIKEMVNNFGHISALLQRIDCAVTYDWNIKNNNFTVFIYVIKGRPVGILTTDLNKERKIIADFAVLPHMQRQGIGKKLVDAAIEYANINIDEWAFSSPSSNSVNFLHKWYGLEKLWICQ